MEIMMDSYHLIKDARFRDDRYVSEIVFDSEEVRTVRFCLKAGQTVKPHTSTSVVNMLIVSGSGTIGVGDGSVSGGPGTYAACPKNVPHGFTAETDMVLAAFIAPRP
jgi:quercetin dioxygenase-like cupin family protein